MSSLPRLLIGAVFLIAPGCTPSDYERGQMAYEHGDYKSAIEYFEPLANGGDRAAQLALATAYRCGDSNVLDGPEATKWYKAVKVHDNAIAHELFAKYYEIAGVEPNPLREREQKTIAAELGNANANTLFHLSNILASVDQDASLHWLTVAAEKDHIYAQYMLGQNYRDGRDVPVDPKQSIAWFRRAAENEYFAAQIRVAQDYKSGYGGIEVDYDAAVRLYESAISNESGSAPYYLGWMYAKGTGVPRNEAKACSLYRTGADRGDDKAALELATCFHEGKGVERDLIEAYRWYTLATRIAEKNLSYFLERRPQLADFRTGNHIAVEEPLERLTALESVMTQSEIAEAELLLEEWESDYKSERANSIRYDPIWGNCP